LKRKYLSIQFRLICIFLVVATIIIFVNLIIYYKMSSSMKQIDSSYSSNKDLVALHENLDNIQLKLSKYLTNRNNSDLLDYYTYSEQYKEKVTKLNNEILEDNNLLLEKNIRNISISYLKVTEETIDKKKDRQMTEYTEGFNEATKLYTYLDNQINLLNNSQFKDNTESYSKMLNFFKKTELLNICILIITIILCIILILFVIRNFIAPLNELVKAANKIGDGNLDIKIKPSIMEDEINVVIVAFNKMVVSLKEHIQKLKESMILENKFKQREILMEAHLKDSQLKCLQAQINPHFLFNTLNAGAQLAMLEDANQTYNYIHKVADFFRYNVKKDSGISTLTEEIVLVDNYIYILNVRFAGDIHYTKDIDETVLSSSVPSMFLQPIIENCIKHGFSNEDVKKNIHLCVKASDDIITVSVKDTGIGMTKDKLESILSKKDDSNSSTDNEENSIGINNVYERLRLFYKKDDVMTITSEGLGKGTTVTMYINR